MFEDVLIPTDGSDPSRRAAKTGIDLAAEHGATVHALYVVRPIHSDEGGTEEAIQAMRATGERTVAELAEQADASGLEAITDVTMGTPHREILEYAAANDIDLVVMGTHGRTGIGRYLLGSVTEKVVRLSDVPVLTVRTHPDGEG